MDGAWLVGAAVVGLAVGAHFVRERRWQRFGAQLGLRALRRPRRLEGEVDGVSLVATSRIGEDTRAAGLYLELGPVPGLPVAFECQRREAPVASWGGRPVVEPVTGDMVLDLLAAVRAPQPWRSAALTRDVRAHLVELLTRRGGVADGRLAVMVEAQLVLPDVAEVRAAIDRLRSLAAALVFPPDETHARLAAVTTTDAEAAVRRLALEALLEDAVRAPGTPLEQARRLQSAEPALRLAAASQMDVLAANQVLSELVPAETSDEIREAALRTLASRRVDEARALARDCLGEDAPRLRLTAVRLLAASPEDRARLLALDAGSDADLGRTLAETFASFGAEAEPALLGLARHANADVQRLAVEALGQVGTREAVAPLQQRAAERGLSSELREAALTAVRRIQSRLGGGAGQLSLAAPSSEGALSLAPAHGDGALTLADED